MGGFYDILRREGWAGRLDNTIDDSRHCWGRKTVIAFHHVRISVCWMAAGLTLKTVWVSSGLDINGIVRQF
jgi:hypothetical protein